MESGVKKSYSKQSMSLIMTITIILIIVGIVSIAKESMRTEDWKVIQTVSDKVDVFTDRGLNEEEKGVLTLVADWIDSPATIGKDNLTYFIYFNYLKECYSSPEVALSSAQATEIEDLISGRNKIVFLENESDVNKMSFDGRNVTIYILKQIYELSGLKLMISKDGDIEQITDLSGNNIFLNNNQLTQSGFQVDVLVIIIITLLVLLCICFIIARKNQLFVKGGRYDGFDEKKYA